MLGEVQLGVDIEILVVTLTKTLAGLADRCQVDRRNRGLV